MEKDDAQKVLALPEYYELLRCRRRLVLPLVVIMLVAYYGFILAIAFAPTSLGEKVGDGIGSIGIYIGLGLVVLSFAVSGIYLKLASGKIRSLLAAIHSKAQ